MASPLLAKVGTCIVHSALGSQTCTLDSFWRDQTCIITFFRRLGCKFCRLEAKNLSHLKPALDARNIKLMGITFDEGGVKEFVDGHYFDGDLYLDPERKTYKALEYKKVSACSGFCSLLTKAGRSLNSKAKAANIPGNMTGDGWQTGGLLVVEKGGKVLYHFEQKEVVNHPDYKQIIDVLKINPKDVPEFATVLSQECDDACKM
ncbi:unnamed protein product [Schistosoma guineensis]|uniref:Prostamide/prostaglandin F synthase n=1 Tax=Schistosoma bovis TaxID=6184 RepID=A0A430Q2J1_SCHBO|nr:uncharacterized protein DC041_0012618 [Schistosoma bovis]CAH8569437.1 unnamed protein product [Schistosoma intercalatum]CAH8581078.1 unnamed protein product [Schistosoma guineensis]CAH8585484.1 unnamed protein product [Schistosoma curassoni]CAH8570564.1 unnamed protein product [Schistosoma intercalatum]